MVRIQRRSFSALRVARFLIVATALTWATAASATIPCVWEPEFGRQILSGDDATTGVNLGITFPFQGSNYTSGFISTNGFIAFGSNPGSGCCDGDVNQFLAGPPRIALVWSDLITTVFQNTLTNRVVFTWSGTEFSGTAPHRYQMQLFNDGRVMFGYELLPPVPGGGGHRHHGLVGVTPGGGASNPGEVDFSTAPPLTTGCVGTAYQFFARGPNGATGPDPDPYDLEGNAIVFRPTACRGWLVANCSSDGVCCVDGQCHGPMSRAACEHYGGTFQGPASDCHEVTCPPTRGACCVNGGCYVVTPQVCAEHHGTFHGLGSTCQGRNCSVGACCKDGVCHGPMPHSLCDFYHGSYQGNGTTCSGARCGE